MRYGITDFYAKKCRFCKDSVGVISTKVIMFFESNVASSILIIINTSFFAILVLFLLYANFSKKCQGVTISLIHPVVAKSMINNCKSIPANFSFQDINFFSQKKNSWFLFNEYWDTLTIHLKNVLVNAWYEHFFIL